MAKKGPSSLGIVFLLLLALLAPWRINCVLSSRQELHPWRIDGERRKLIPVSASCSLRGGGGRGGGCQDGGGPRPPRR
ncbi:hypothetical protein ISN45_Aa03g034270 [Arabidopsis thaliana x Arabidopsis arenosa]|uniref:Uncharacterized protein n=2 Tax=Arabidopsis TaxID=3701 RepID=A0A8T2B9F8_ARASU|nr:hypothetical protein ISN45_Aa03g034270 [Arabidopsis thaliana x Arabidopsis arenosa]KAG7583947.1 hypothetical protein ISN44_As08g034440 [Arabidopsis suecica]